MQSLSNVRRGEICTIKWLMGDDSTLKLMKDYEIEEGSTVRVIQQRMGDVIIGFRDVRLALGCQIAERIKV